MKFRKITRFVTVVCVLSAFAINFFSEKTYLLDNEVNPKSEHSIMTWE